MLYFHIPAKDVIMKESEDARHCTQKRIGYMYRKFYPWKTGPKVDYLMDPAPSPLVG